MCADTTNEQRIAVLVSQLRDDAALMPQRWDELHQLWWETNLPIQAAEDEAAALADRPPLQYLDWPAFVKATFTGDTLGPILQGIYAPDLRKATESYRLAHLGFCLGLNNKSADPWVVFLHLGRVVTGNVTMVKKLSNWLGKHTHVQGLPERFLNAVLVESLKRHGRNPVEFPSILILDAEKAQAAMEPLPRPPLPVPPFKRPRVADEEENEEPPARKQAKGKGKAKAVSTSRRVTRSSARQSEPEVGRSGQDQFAAPDVSSTFVTDPSSSSSIAQPGNAGNNSAFGDQSAINPFNNSDFLIDNAEASTSSNINNNSNNDWAPVVELMERLVEELERRQGTVRGNSAAACLARGTQATLLNAAKVASDATRFYMREQEEED